MTRATAALPPILCEKGYKSPEQMANPQSHGFLTECQKLKQKSTKWIEEVRQYINCIVLISGSSSYASREEWQGLLLDDKNKDCAGTINQIILAALRAIVFNTQTLF